MSEGDDHGPNGKDETASKEAVSEATDPWSESPTFEIPEDIQSWLSDKLQQDVALVFNTEITSVLVKVYLDYPGKYLQVTKVLKKHNIYSRVQQEIRTLARAENVRRLAERRRSTVREPRNVVEGLSFAVNKLVVYTSDPPIYEFHVVVESDKSVNPLIVDSHQFDTAKSFCTRFREILHHVPEGLDVKPPEWKQIQNEWLRKAEYRAASEESSEVGSIRRLIRDILRGLPMGEHLDDLKHGHVLPATKDQHWLAYNPWLKTEVSKLYKQTIKAGLWNFILSQLKIVEDRVRIDGKQIRALVFHRRLDETEDPDPDWHRRPEDRPKESGQESIFN